VFDDEPMTVLLTLPTEALLRNAMDAVREMYAQGTPPTREQRLIHGLLDAYVLHAELLTRCVIHGRGETGDADFDAEQLEVALDIAHDVCRAGLRADDAPPEVPDSIRLDIGNWSTDSGLESIPLAERDAPTPTTFEA